MRKFVNFCAVLWVVSSIVFPGASMAASNKPLKGSDEGTLSELMSRPNPARLVIVAVPSLSALLLKAEKSNGKPLTRRQVEALRDRAPAIAVPSSAAEAVEERRGYKDVDFSTVWEEWQIRRRQFDQSKP